MAVGFTSLLVNEALSIGEKEANAREARSTPGGIHNLFLGKAISNVPSHFLSLEAWFGPGENPEQSAQKRSAIISLRLSRNS